MHHGAASSAFCLAAHCYLTYLVAALLPFTAIPQTTCFCPATHPTH